MHIIHTASGHLLRQFLHIFYIPFAFNVLLFGEPWCYIIERLIGRLPLQFSFAKDFLLRFGFFIIAEGKLLFRLLLLKLLGIIGLSRLREPAIILHRVKNF
jgi:hypothetical protein